MSTSTFVMDQMGCADGNWQVSRCRCGHVELRLGTTRIAFTPEEFSQLHRLVAEAMAAFDIAPSERTVSHEPQTTH